MTCCLFFKLRDRRIARSSALHETLLLRRHDVAFSASHPRQFAGCASSCCRAGAADGSLKVWDRRKLPANGSVADGTLHTFNYHSEAIMRVEWHPTERVSCQATVL
jgi:hypothetical protein